MRCLGNAGYAAEKIVGVQIVNAKWMRWLMLFRSRQAKRRG